MTDALEARVRLLEDLEAIRQLKATYCQMLDGGWSQKGATHLGPVADLFVSDGIWDGRPAVPRAEGREAIRQLMIDSRVVPFVMHLAVNPIIQVTGDEATGTWSVILPWTIGARPGIGVGTYDEEYVRTPEGWRFRSLRFVLARSAATASEWRPSQ